MKIDSNLQGNAILQEITVRMKQYRIDSGLTQEEYADKSMVSLSTVRRFESGKDISLSNLIKLLLTLRLDSNLDMLVPDCFDRPSYHIENVKIPKRVRKHSAKKSEWQWGEDK